MKTIVLGAGMLSVVALCVTTTASAQTPTRVPRPAASTAAPQTSPALTRESTVPPSRTAPAATARSQTESKASLNIRNTAADEELRALKAELARISSLLAANGIAVEVEQNVLSDEQLKERAALESRRKERQADLDALEQAVAGGLQPRLVQKEMEQSKAEIASLDARIDALNNSSADAPLPPLPAVQASTDENRREIEAIKMELTALRRQTTEVKPDSGEFTAAVPVSPGEAAPAADAEPGGAGIAGWEGGFFVKTLDDRFRLKLNGIVKTLFVYANDEKLVDDADNSSSAERDNHAAFTVPYLRFVMSGNLFSPRLVYAFIYDFAPNRLIEGWADWAFVKNKFHLTVGLGKRPYSRDFLNSTAANNMIYLSPTRMGEAVDVGILFSNNYTRVKGLEWAFGLSNGSAAGAWAATNAFNDFSPAIVGRIGFNNGVNGYVASDFDGGPFRYGIAFSGITEFDHDNNNASSHFASLDAIFKVQGLSISTAIYMEWLAVETLFDDPDLNRIGSFIKAGWLIRKRVEPVARYSMVHNSNVDNDIANEITMGLNIYFFGQNLKWENNVSLLTQRIGPADADPHALQDIRIASQLQLAF